MKAETLPGFEERNEDFGLTAPDGKHYWITPPDRSQGKGTGRHIAAFILDSESLPRAAAAPITESASEPDEARSK